MGWRERLEGLDRRVIFVFIFVAVSLPLFRPLGLPVRVSKEVQGAYDAIERLPAGSVVYFAGDFDPASMPELYPMTLSTLKHLFRKDVKVVAATLWPAGGPPLERALKDVGEGEYGKKYGVDFVNLGFKEGRELVMVRLGEAIAGAYPQDYYGTPVSRLPLLQKVRNLNDCALIVNISAGYPGTKEWVQQVRSRFNVRMISGCTAVSTPEYYPYLQARQLDGLMGGLAGASEYEKLVGVPGLATRGMDAQSLGHVTIIAFILIGNALFHLARRRAGAGGKG
jgi:hypothetical protein